MSILKLYFRSPKILRILSKELNSSLFPPLKELLLEGYFPSCVLKCLSLRVWFSFVCRKTGSYTVSRSNPELWLKRVSSWHAKAVSVQRIILYELEDFKRKSNALSFTNVPSANLACLWSINWKILSANPARNHLWSTNWKDFRTENGSFLMNVSGIFRFFPNLAQNQPMPVRG